MFPLKFAINRILTMQFLLKKLLNNCKSYKFIYTIHECSCVSNTGLTCVSPHTGFRGNYNLVFCVRSQTSECNTPLRHYSIPRLLIM